MLQLSILLMLPVNLFFILPVANRIHLQRNKFGIGMENKVTVDSKLNGNHT